MQVKKVVNTVKKSFISLDPPPEPSSVVVVKRKYSSLARDLTFSDCGFLLSGSAPVWSTYMFGIAMNICIGRVATYIFDNCNWQLRGHIKPQKTSGRLM
jgi:hypothetical protein